MTRNKIKTAIYRAAAVLTMGIALNIYGCYKDSAPNMPSSGDSAGTSGQGGSMACFTIVGDYMYAVTDTTLKTIDISDPAHPKAMPFKDQKLGFEIETIFSYDNKLFIGSRTGMYIYDITRPGFPQYLSMTEHLRSCDPVVAAGGYAYVTLNSENRACWRGEDMLLVYDITDPRTPTELYSDRSIYSPRGLGIDEAAARLFVCCRGGMKIYDISDPQQPIWVDDLSGLKDTLEPYDVIPHRGMLIVTAQEGLYQFDYTGDRIRYVSKIETQQEE